MINKCLVNRRKAAIEENKMYEELYSEEVERMIVDDYHNGDDENQSEEDFDWGCDDIYNDDF